MLAYWHFETNKEDFPRNAVVKKYWALEENGYHHSLTSTKKDSKLTSNEKLYFENWGRRQMRICREIDRCCTQSLRVAREDGKKYLYWTIIARYKMCYTKYRELTTLTLKSTVITCHKCSNHYSRWAAKNSPKMRLNIHCLNHRGFESQKCEAKLKLKLTKLLRNKSRTL